MTTHNDSLRACIASLFELDIYEVPKFEALGEKWLQRLIEFCALKGYEFKGYGDKDSISDVDANGGNRWIYLRSWQ